MKNFKYIGILVVVLMACQPNGSENSVQQLDLQGHRGARGLMPENSVPGFLEALNYSKVTTLELDLAVTRDQELIVSHEPWFNPTICTSGSDSLALPEEKSSIYQMTYAQVVQYDCGSLGNPRFPEQKKMDVVKPRLKDVISAVNEKLSEQGRTTINYNIEIKSSPEGDSIYHPVPSEFADLVVTFLKENRMMDNTTIQSFDFRPLRYIKEKYPQIKLVALVENEKGHESNLKELGFLPDVYSPYHKLLTEETIRDLQDKKVQVVPWTVNDPADMQQLIDWGIDGIITDYPNLAQKILEK